MSRTMIHEELDFEPTPAGLERLCAEALVDSYLRQKRMFVIQQLCEELRFAWADNALLAAMLVNKPDESD